MALFGTCPRCNSPLHNSLSSGNIRAGSLNVCTKCGWFESKSQAVARVQAENRTIGVMASTAVALVLVGAHMLSWGSHAFSIPMLKVGQWTGTLSAQGYDELAQVCMDLNKFACARTAFIESFQKNRTAEPLQKLARLQVRMQETQQAMVTFSTYFKNGGRDGEAALIYGQLLEQAGQDEEALKAFDLSITSRPDQLPIAATGAIARILMKQGRYEEAQERLVNFQASAGNAKGYLNTELSQVEQAIALYRPKGKIAKKG